MKKMIFSLFLGVIILSGCNNTEEPNEVDEKVDELSWETKDYFEMVHIDVIHGDEVLSFSANTNARTLGDVIDEENSSRYFIELEDVGDGRIVKAFNDFENNKDNRWVILSKSCSGEGEESQQCDDNVDSIILDDEEEFALLYVDMKDLEYVEDKE